MDEQMPQNTPKKGNPALWIILVVVVLIVVAAILYFGGVFNTNTNSNTNAAANANTNTETNVNVVANTNASVNQNTNVNANTTTNTNSVSNTNSSVDTSDWVSYLNSDPGFSIKYPANWDIEEGDTYLNIYSESTDDDGIPEANELKVVISWYNDVNSDLEAWISSFAIENSTVASFDINGVTAREVTGQIEQMGARFDIHYVFYLSNSTGLVFSAIPPDSEFSDIFSDIVRSLELL